MASEVFKDTEQTAPFRVKEKANITFDEEGRDVLEMATHWANLSQSDARSKQLLLSLLERRDDSWVEILGLDVLALKKLVSGF